MPWPYQFSGHTAAEYPMTIHGGGSIPSYLLKPRNQWAELFDKIAPAIKDYLQQKKSDEIANQLMNMEDAKRAQPVMENGQYVSGGPGMDAAGVQTFNTSLGFPGTYKTPERGGQQSYQMQKMYQDYLNNQPDTAMDDVKYLQEWNKAHPEESGADGMTPYQRETTRLRELDINRKLNNPHGTAKADPWENAMAVARGEVDGEGKFKGANNGSMLKLVTPNGYSMIVPWASYEARKQQFSGAKAFQDRQAQMTEPDLPVKEPEITRAPEAGSTPSVTTEAEYKALPSGTIYIAPDGTKRRKP